MKRGLLRVLVWLCLWGSAQWVWAQQKRAEEVLLKQLPETNSLSQALHEISGQAAITIFYTWAELDTVKLKPLQAPISFDTWLSAQLQGTPFAFSVDAYGRWIITRFKAIDQTWETKTQAPDPLSTPESGPLAPLIPELSEETLEEDAVRQVPISVGRTASGSGKKATLAGYVTDPETTEPIIGARVLVESLDIGVNTDGFGYYSLTLEPGEYELIFRAYGKEEFTQNIILYGDGQFDLEMQDDIRMLDEVVIEAERDANVSSTQMGLTRLGIQTLQQMPAFMGEIDVVKSALLLPGVQSVGEGATGFNVRGGAADQNLIMINQAPIFNSSHLFGFFSVFNPDLIQSFDLYKSGIPARYGGRLASVLDIQMKDGNKKRFSARGGISPITGRLMVEGPIQKNKSSFIIGGRSTYSRWILDQFRDPAIRNSDANFRDLNGKINIELNDKNRLDLAGYFSQDYFLLNQDTAYRYQNLNGSLSWKHMFNNKLFALTSLVGSQYDYELTTQAEESRAFRLAYQIRYQEAKTAFTYIPQPRHQFRFGANLIRYDLKPGTRSALGPESVVQPLSLDAEQALEGAIFISDEYEVNNRLKLYAGLRFSSYFQLGPNKTYQYRPGASLKPANTQDSVLYDAGQLVQTYAGPEFRFSARYALDDVSSMKLSFNRMRQYLHMLSNTTSISPTDTWKLSDPFIRPQTGDQLSLGYYRNFRQNSIEASVEIYGKLIRDMLEFKNGAQLLLNPQVETDLVAGKGRAYGIELLVKKARGKFNGWISYTYARTFMQVEASFPDEVINRGERYPANVDKPHDFSLVSNYKFSRRLSVSSNVAYSTGRPITYPVAQYQFGGGTRLSYSARNQFRVPDYFRWDLAVNIEGNHRVDKAIHNSLSFSVYNVLGRKNVYSVYFVTEADGVQGYRLSIFGRPIVTLTYNFTL
ncbi:MAG: TonB-dependent receptor [Bacteroidota bacterium]